LAYIEEFNHPSLEASYGMAWGFKGTKGLKGIGFDQDLYNLSDL